MSKDGVWIDDLLSESLTNIEKLWREIYRLTDKYCFKVKMCRYPLIMNKLHYMVTIYKIKNKTWTILFEEKEMELELLLKKLKRKLDEYDYKHKEYIVNKNIYER